MSNLLAHAIRELALIVPPGGCDMQEEMNREILEIVEAFADQGHSGMSAGYAIAALQKLLRYEPLTPLTGEDSEWLEVGPGVFQNKRCGRVFKEDGKAYDIDGKVFVEPSGACYTNRESRVPVTFPYVPKTEHVFVQEEA